MQDEVERELLFVEKNELLTFADLISCHREQLPAGRCAEAFEFVGKLCARDSRREAGSEEVNELTSTLAGEHLCEA